MTFASISSNVNQPVNSALTALQTIKLSKTSIAALVLAILGLTTIPNLLWMDASHPAELTPCQKQVVAGELPVTK
ncbi:hypothetical protein [Chamaesiphon minutus]|uniref:Uncharacterized protein n=1 Tax=Chamaesiphon minutus (strain ATCC 27169 / PCC 6605) TaxID=1173020 RepID=K9UHE9_CHAP6|nr:hypothetical protein [Chamaesiphon minutus]AFY93639.1 hypothetical protein Cha6605_2592 [Chamaesiphon minutus PCC 6605]